MLMSDETIIDSTIYETTTIALDHDQNDLSFEYAALHFARSEKNQYAHLLEGYDNEWRYDNRRFATYTNLDPGRYVFRVRGSNSDGVWNNDGMALNITILPPWWQTIWAYLGYGILFIGLIIAIDRLQRRRLLARERQRQEIQESELRAETAELKTKAVEAERRALEIEFEQKKKELEEARELQLSMLPKELPKLPHLDIAVYMKTATEVGGDYYDFNVSMDGTLTVVIGDATGHGMKAGTMVTAAKSLFNTHAQNPDILFTFNEITRCIKTMHMKMLSMCLTIMKIQGNKLTMSAAGMPPALFYKRDIQSVEEIVIKGMPLGTFKEFPYEIQERTLAPGDTILLMSDGMPELFNKDKEMFGYKRIRDTFEEVVEKSPEEIIDHLNNTGLAWKSDGDPDDDVTFVVLKIK
jgi:serine phosphatase RsbU (regulator of sigma subunit)